MRRVARGDEAAFERLYDLLVGPLFGAIRRVVRDPAQSEEVAQEVMIELWRSAARYPASGLGAARQVGITIEPAGGSEQPSTEPIIDFDLA